METTKGLNNSILVRPLSADKFELVDGGHRLSVAEELGWETIECVVREMTDQEAFLCQLTNAHTIPTTSEQYRQHLRTYLEIEPDTNVFALAGLISKSTTWVKKNLRILELDDECQDLMARGELSLTNAYHLTRIPESGRAAFIKHAVHLNTHQFKTLVAEEIRRRQVRRKADNTKARLKNLGAKPFIPRPIAEIKQQLASGQRAAELIADINPESRLDAFQLGVMWAYQQVTQ